MSIKYWSYTTFDHLVPQGYGTLYGPDGAIIKQGDWSTGYFTGEGESKRIYIDDLMR
jgi:hypothetical protein